MKQPLPSFSYLLIPIVVLCAYTPSLYAWDRSTLQGPVRQEAVTNDEPQKKDDTGQKGIVRTERLPQPLQLRPSEPVKSSPILREPSRSPENNMIPQGEHHPNLTPSVPPPHREGPKPHIPTITANHDKNPFQRQPSIADREFQPPPSEHLQRAPMHQENHDGTLGKNPFQRQPSADRDFGTRPTEHLQREPIDQARHGNTFIKPFFEHRDRDAMERMEVRPHTPFDHRDKGIDRDRHPKPPFIAERIQPPPGTGFYREMPREHRRILIKNHWYFIHEGRFYRRAYDGFIWIAPPVGLVVTTLPPGCTRFVWYGVEYYTYAGIYYRPTYGGYVVVEEPEDLPCPWDLDPPPVNLVIVNTQLLNVRTGPGEDFPVIEQVMYGERLQVLGSYYGWYYIRMSNGRKGWVLAYYTYPDTYAEPMG